MITFADIESHLRRFSYKPGWKFKVDGITTGFPYTFISASYSAPDSADPTRTVPIFGTLPINEYIMESDEFTLHTFDKLYLTDLIRHCDRHEVEEWLRYDGQRIVDPHPKVVT
jgi:hypothetical protein